MDESTASSEIAYPSKDVLSRGSSFMNLSTQASQNMDSLWLQVKTQGGVDSYAVWSMAALAAALAVYLIIRETRRKRRIANRCKKWKEAYKRRGLRLVFSDCQKVF
jgi:phosphotransferase system  glucose/maltose/N-acetylglucosamine-specific IIC component